MSQYKNPSWWNADYDTAWERVKAAFQRDWDQTRHDLGVPLPDTDQDVPDTVEQAAGTKPIPPRGIPTYEEVEPAFRFGYGARRHYGERFPAWNADLEWQLAEDWRSAHPDEANSWTRFRPNVRRGWEQPDIVERPAESEPSKE